ncbi:hypothetical protein L593_04940 [Salinarchaeum sp. Harcht-Bsk1]|nr:hypothetical protein L593_04940 [Salinarchaeum sp. Harcht-Bsk1]
MLKRPFRSVVPVDEMHLVTTLSQPLNDVSDVDCTSPHHRVAKGYGLFGEVEDAHASTPDPAQ